MNLKALVGSGEKIGLLTLLLLIVGLAFNILDPSLFTVGGPPVVLRVLSIIILIPGIAISIWSVALILTRVPERQPITSGSYALVKHPL
jgi:protein-S-isoprenylcysteine O-methyltransferase Ste14